MKLSKNNIIFIFIVFFLILVCFFIIGNKNNNNSSNIEVIDENVILNYGDVKDLEKLVKKYLDSKSTFKWSSSNEDLINVDDNGILTTNSNNGGSAIISVCTFDNKDCREIKVVVKKVEDVINVTDISLNYSNVTLNYKESVNLIADVIPSNATNKKVVFESNNPNLVKVSDNGLITVLKNIDGEVDITVSSVDSNIKKTVKVYTKHVLEYVSVTGIVLDKNVLNLNYGDSVKVNATIKPENATNKNIIWSSSNNNLVTVDNSGYIKAVGNKDGNCTITAKSSDGKYSSTIKVTVKKKNVVVPVEKVTISSPSIIYLNGSSKTAKVSATVVPSNATDKEIILASSNPKVATISNGIITAHNLGETKIVARNKSGQVVASSNLVVSKKVIAVVTASAGLRMNNYFPEYTSSSGFKYSKSDKTLFYIYKSGSGFEYQYGEGLNEAKKAINAAYPDNRKYVNLSLFFTLTGNSVRNMSCSEINTTNEYNNIANKYNAAVSDFKNLNYSVKGYVLSHNPLNTKDAINNYPEKAKSSKIVYSHKKEACMSGYRSAYKYWISNKRFESVVGTGKYPNIKYVDAYSNIVVLTDEKERKFTWKTNSSGVSYVEIYKTEDGLHWNSTATKLYMQLAFDKAGM